MMTNHTTTHISTPIMVGEGIKFERIRRVTGYLVGTLDRFNNAKKAEERDRIKHSVAMQNTNAEEICPCMPEEGKKIAC